MHSCTIHYSESVPSAPIVYKVHNRSIRPVWKNLKIITLQDWILYAEISETYVWRILAYSLDNRHTLVLDHELVETDKTTRQYRKNMSELKIHLSASQLMTRMEQSEWVILDEGGASSLISFYGWAACHVLSYPCCALIMNAWPI